MATLSIRNERSGAAWQVWPEAEAVPAGAIAETGSYLFELAGLDEAGAADLLIDDQPLEALRSRSPDAARWRWLPGFHAGVVDAELRLPGGRQRRFEVITDPDRQKLTRDDFDTMVREILDDTFALFSLSSFRKGVARGVGTKPPPLARLEFLRTRIEELEAVVGVITRRPRRRLVAEEGIVAWHRATRATGPEILKSMRTGRILIERNSPSRLPPALKGMLPEKLHVSHRRSSLDLPEHRQMGASLRAWSDWLDGVSDVLARASGAPDNETLLQLKSWARRCRGLARRTASLAGSEPFAEAADAAPRLTLSALFRNDPNYRRFFQIAQDMNLGIAAIFGDFLDMPLARTFELYELWCFLRLVRAGAEEFGTDGLSVDDLFVSEASGGLTVAARAVTVAVGEGWRMCFQKQYREFWIEPGGRGSFSRTMTPDIAIQGVAGAQDSKPQRERLIILDAKYRIDEGLNAALSSIHTYRDALVREIESGRTEGIVTAAYLLTPFVAITNDSFKDTPMPGRLFHPEYRSSFRFGAVTLRPGMAIAEVGEALQVIVADATA